MKIYFSPASPFVRKVMVTAHEIGIADGKIERIALPIGPTTANPALSRDNPLTKVPTLVTEGGEILYDSPVICEYLDSLHDGRKLIPAAGGERWRVLRLQAMADGVMDAGILLRYEAALRPEEKRWQNWIDGQTSKIVQSLDAIEADSDQLSGAINIGQISVGCAIGWLEFRKPIGDIRPGRPRLFKWYDAFAQRPSMLATVPKA